MTHKFRVVDETGRLWVTTLTAIKARRLAKELTAAKGLVMHVEAI